MAADIYVYTYIYEYIHKNIFSSTTGMDLESIRPTEISQTEEDTDI